MSTAITCFPSCSLNDYFSVSHKGKRYELSCCEKTAIVFTAIIGLAMVGVGVLFTFYCSYRMRQRLFKEIVEDEPIAARVAQARERIQGPPSITINGERLDQGSYKGRYFINIGHAVLARIPGFNPLSLPRGIYATLQVSGRSDDDLMPKSDELVKELFPNRRYLCLVTSDTKPLINLYPRLILGSKAGWDDQGVIEKLNAQRVQNFLRESE